MTAVRFGTGGGGISIDRVGLGTAPIGGLFEPVSDDAAMATLAAAWDANVRYFDTAPHYGAGLAERRLGRFFEDHPRDQSVVSTKVGRLLVPGEGRQGDDSYWGGPKDRVRQRDYTRDGVLRSIHDSLERTRLDRFDIVLIHDPDDHWREAIDYAYPALAELRSQGVVSAIGVGMNQWQMLLRFVQESDLDVILLAGRYTLLDRTAEEKLLPACLDRGVAVVAGGVFNSGVLAAPTADSHFDYERVSAPILEHASALRRSCASYDVPLAAAAIQFPLRHSAVHTVVIGARSPEEIVSDLDLLDCPIPAELWEELDKGPFRR